MYLKRTDMRVNNMTQNQCTPNPWINCDEPLKAEFDAAVIDVVDVVFSGLGENVKVALYNILQIKYGITKQAIPSRLEDFAVALNDTFGDAAKLLEIKIMELIHSKAEKFLYEPTEQEFFAQYMVAFHTQMTCCVP